MRHGMPAADRDPISLRRAAGWSLVGGLCLAAAVAVLAVLTGSFDDTDWRVIASSLGFSVFSAAAAAGAAVRLRPAPWAGPLGGACIAASAAAYGLLLGGLWVATGADVLWRAFGVAALAALWTAHAALVLRARRPDDGVLVRRLATVSIVSLGVEAVAGELALLGLLDDVSTRRGRAAARRARRDHGAVHEPAAGAAPPGAPRARPGGHAVPGRPEPTGGRGRRRRRPARRDGASRRPRARRSCGCASSLATPARSPVPGTMRGMSDHARVAVVTGAGSGIGRVVARALLDDGYRVALAGRREETLRDTAGDAAGALVVPADVRDPASVTALFTRTGRRSAGSTCCSTTLACSGRRAVRGRPARAVGAVVATNLTGAFLCAQAAFRAMRDQRPRGGRIINNGSISAHVPRPTPSPTRPPSTR